MRVALVHDYLTQLGGAERVLAALMKVFPHAPVFTLVANPELVNMLQKNPSRPPLIKGGGRKKSPPDKGEIGGFNARRIRTSFLQHFPGSRKHHRYFPLLMPLAIEQFDLSAYDVVLSASHSFGKGVLTGPNTLHISYCFTPTRYVWDDSHRYVREFSPSRFFQRLAPLGISYIRLWDYFASQRVDVYATLSDYVARRIRKYYQRGAHVIAPPVDVNRFAMRESNDGYCLVVSRLVPYKRVELAIEACEELGWPLKIAGTGPELAELKRRAGQQTEFLGFVPDRDLPALYAGAKALLFPQEEDFGITPLEAAACGKPTVALAAGGALETIVPGVTGTFFDEQTVPSLVQAMLASERIEWDPRAIRAHAETFRAEVFMDKMREFVHNEWLGFQQDQQGRRGQ